MANNNNPWGRGSQEFEKWGKGSPEYTKWLPDNAAYNTGINPNTGQSAEDFGNSLLNERITTKINTFFISLWSGKTLFIKNNFNEKGNEEYMVNNSFYVRTINETLDNYKKLRESNGEEFDIIESNSESAKISLYSETNLVTIDYNSFINCLTITSNNKIRNGESIEQLFTVFFDRDNKVIQAIMEDDSKNTIDKSYINFTTFKNHSSRSNN